MVEAEQSWSDPPKELTDLGSGKKGKGARSGFILLELTLTARSSTTRAPRSTTTTAAAVTLG